MGIFKKAVPAATILAVLMSLLTPATPAHAWLPQTWNTQAAFNAGVLTNVDTASSPNNVLLGSNLNTGDGSDGALTVTDETRFPNTTGTALSSTSYIGSSYIEVNSTAGFAAGQEVLIIQMTGTGAGTWETIYIAGVEPSLLVFSHPLKNAYYADVSSKVQVIKVPHYTTVTINPGGILMCMPWLWDGQTGGVIFFRATGTVTVNPGGLILASGLGFNGGNGGSGAYGGSGGGGGMGGGDNSNSYPNGGDGWVSGTGGTGGYGGVNVGGAGYNGGAGAQYGNPGSRSSGSSGAGPGGASADRGGTNGSSASLSLMQIGGGGGGGSSGTGGYGGGGGGGGGYNTCRESKKLGGGPYNGNSGNSGGNPGSGGNGNSGGGLISIHAKSIVVQYLIQADGGSGAAGSAGNNGGSGGSGGRGQNWCFVSEDNPGSAGGGGGGGGGAQGGGGGNGGCGGSGGTIWLAAENIAISQTNGVMALGGLGLAGGAGGNGGGGGGGGSGGSGDHDAAGQNGGNGPNGGNGAAGTAGGAGGTGAIRLDYAILTGSTNPAPGYTSGVYNASGAIASNVWDTGAAGQTWNYLNWQETVPATTGITFAARASDIIFAKDDNTIPWIPVGSTSPVTSGLPSGRYMQWQATLATSNNFYTPVLSSVTAATSLLPLVATDAATFVSSNGAVANGTLLALGQRSSTVHVQFEWGTTPTPDLNWQQTAPLAVTAPGPYSEGLNPLSPGTTYYYRARAYDLSVADPVYGDVVSFSTTPISPSVNTNAAGSVTAGSAVLNGYLGALGISSTVPVSFQWGTSQGGPYPNSTTPQAMTATGPFQASLSRLGTGTTYYYRAKADGGVNGINYGAEMNFATLRIAPLMATGHASSLTSSSATLNGSLANMGAASTVNVCLQWGTTQGGPYPNSTPAQAMTVTGPFSAGLTGLAAKTIYYFRAKGDGGTSGISYGSENSFTTSVVQPTVVTNGATGITSTSALLNGNLTAMGTAATVDVTFYYGLQPGEFNHTAWQTLSAPGSFQANLAGLTSDTLYYFRTVAQGDGNSVDGAELTFRTSRVPPTVTTNGATLVTTVSATLNGTLTGVGSAASDNVSFQWGITSGMYSAETAPQAMSATGDFLANLTGLTSATTYYYRAKANGGIAGIGYGDEHSFTTGSQPPSVTTNNASQLTTNSAMLNGNLNSLGTATTVNVSFQWGTTRGGPYPNSTAPQARSATGAFQSGLSGLASQTTYYYRAKANSAIFGTGYGAEKSFSTSSFPPYVTTGQASSITANAATLNGNLYFMGSANTVNVYFVYGTVHNGPYTGTTPLQPLTAAGAFTAPLSGLNPATTYYYRAMGNGGQYGISRGEEYAFTTSALPPAVITNDASGVTAAAATLNGNLTAPGTATTVNVSFQYGTTAGGPYPYSTGAQAKTAVGAFQASLSGLDANTTYYCIAKGDGGIYGISYGAEKSFTTLKIPPSVTTDNATNITASTASLNGTLSYLGTAPTVNVSFNWGTTAGGPYTNTTTLQTMTATGSFHANISGLSALTTYYYKASADGGGHGSALGSECSFTTGAVPPSVATGAATLVTANSATLNGSLQAMGTSPSDNVSFQWGTSPGVYTAQTTLQPMGAPGDFIAGLTGLNNHTTYYYHAVASGGRHGTGFGQEHAFTTSALPPSVATSAATDWTTNTAFLNGNLTALGTATAVNTSFIYGTNPGGPYPNATPLQVKSGTGTFRAGITGLSPFTTYYFKAKADGGSYGASYGSELSFTTNRLPPVMDTGGAVDVMTNAAILQGSLDLMGTATAVNASFEYGTIHGGPYIPTSQQTITRPDDYQIQLTGLAPSTTYYYRAKGDGGTSGTGYGNEMAFTTGYHPPIASTSEAGSITAASAVLNGNLVSVGSSPSDNVSFQYGTIQGGPYTNTTTPQAKPVPGAFQSFVQGLSAHTAYYFRAVAYGGSYGAGYGREMSFITSNVPPSVATGYATAITTNAARLNGSLSSLGSAASAGVSFQWGSSHGAYTNETVVQSMSGTGSFFADLAGLTQGSTYFFRAKAIGDGTGYGVEQNFATLTPAPPPPSPLIGAGVQTSHGSSLPGTTTTTQPVSLPIIIVQSASLSASKVSPGTPVTVTANVANGGTVNGSTSLKLYVNGEEDSSQGITVESGGNRPVYFTVTRSQPGTYTIYIGGVQAGSFVVAEYIDPDVVLFISLMLIFASFCLGIIYIWRRRQQEY